MPSELGSRVIDREGRGEIEVEDVGSFGDRSADRSVGQDCGLDQQLSIVLKRRRQTLDEYAIVDQMHDRIGGRVVAPIDEQPNPAVGPVVEDSKTLLKPAGK